MQTIQDLQKYKKENFVAIFSHIEIVHLETVKSILKSNNTKVKFRFRGKREPKYRDCLKVNAKAFDVYAR